MSHITLLQFSVLADVSYYIARNWVRDGRINAFKMSGRYWVGKDELDRFRQEGLLPSNDGDSR